MSDNKDLEERQRKILSDQVHLEHLIQGHLSLYIAASYSEDKKTLDFEREQLLTLFGVKLDLLDFSTRVLRSKVNKGLL
jgi:hypothetical protein